ncbi:MAG: hypothetical protein OQL16_12135, partial [Gammaproteobacteria bacterium]|nr:hypothetical protein [Gammaproteobacteria bacterium]
MPYIPCRTLLLAISLMLFYPGVGSCENSGYRSQLLSSNEQASDKLAEIAHYVIERGDNEQREFVMLTLDAMIEAYSQVLQHSYQSTSRTAAERKKKISWGWATSRIIASLNNDLRKIESGADFSLFVDHLQRIMIILEGRTILATGPHTASQSYFEQQVVEYFCINRDCSWLDPKPEPELSKHEAAVKRSLSKGAWHFQQETGPIFVIGGLIYFEFPDFTDRKNKAELCHEIVDEVEQLIT